MNQSVNCAHCELPIDSWVDLVALEKRLLPTGSPKFDLLHQDCYVKLRTEHGFRWRFISIRLSDQNNLMFRLFEFASDVVLGLLMLSLGVGGASGGPFLLAVFGFAAFLAVAYRVVRTLRSWFAALEIAKKI